MTNSKTVPIKELCLGIFDGPHATPPESDTGPVFLRIENIKNGRVDLSDVRHIAESDFPRWVRRVQPQAGDVVFSYEANLGLFAAIPEGFRGCLGRRLALMRPDSTKVNPRFLLYACLASEFQETIRQRTVHGSTVDRILLTDFPNWPITIPNRRMQDMIVEVLGSIDDKIDLNQRMIQTMTLLAKSVYRSWFVDDPRGHVTTLDQICDINARSVTRDFPHCAIEYVDIASVTSGRLEGTTLYQIQDAPSRARRLVKHGDSIWSTVRPNRQSYLFVHSPCDNLVVSTGFVVLSPKQVPPSYLYHAVTTPEFVEYLTVNADGSAYPAVSPRRFAEASILLPSDEMLQAFNAVVEPLMDRIACIERENRALLPLRDTLLPKLISGELRIKDAEKLVGEAT